MTARDEIEDLVSCLGLYIDTKEWTKLENVLGKKVELDYRSLFGGSVEKLPSSEVIALWKSRLTPLKATQHIITNVLLMTETNDCVTCTANVRAVHVRPNDLGDALWTVGGRYNFKMRKEGRGWRISVIQLITLWTTGNPQVLNPQTPTTTETK